MHICIINITLLALCHPDMFQPSNAHLQGVRQIHFKNKVNKIKVYHIVALFCDRCVLGFVADGVWKCPFCRLLS